MRKKVIEIKEEEEKIKDRFRLFHIVLYEDSTSYDFEETLRNLKSYNKYAYIKHIPEKEEKKEHYHIIIKLDNACTIQSLSKKTGVPIQHIQNIRNERSMLRYLIHKDDEDKIQYDISQVKVSSSYERFFHKAFNDIETEEQIICNIYNFITSIVGKGKSRSNCLFYLVQYVNSNCYDNIYKRYRQEFNTYLTDLL